MDMTPLPKSPEVMNTFQETGKKVFYVTNNSTKTRDEFVDKCKTLNFKATSENILCTSYLAANYLKSLSFSRKVYVIGSTGNYLIHSCIDNKVTFKDFINIYSKV